MRSSPPGMGIGDMLDEAFRQVQRNFFAFAGLVAVVEIPLSLAYILLSNALIAPDLAGNEQRLRDLAQQAQSAGTANSATLLKALLGVSRDVIVGLALFMVLSLVVRGVLGGVFSLAFVERYRGGRASIGQLYAAALHRIGPLIGVSLLRSLLLLALIAGPLWAITHSSDSLAHDLPGTDLASAHLSAAASQDLAVLGIAVVALMPLALLGVFLYVRWALYAQAVALEGRGPDSLARSWRLVGGNWWKTFGVLLIGFLAVTVASRVVSAASGRILDAIHVQGGLQTAITWALAIVAAIAALAVSFALQTLLFLDLQAHRDSGAGRR